MLQALPVLPAPPIQVAQLLPVWAVVVLIWLTGAMVTAIGALAFRGVNLRSIDTQIKDLQLAIESQLRDYQRDHDAVHTASDGRVTKLENAVFGLDGDNGLRGDSKATRNEVRAMTVVLRRLADSAGIDTKEIDVLNGV